MKTVKRRVFFRVFPGNRLTIPLLLNVWEANGLDRQFEVRMAEAAPGKLFCRPGFDIAPSDVYIYSFMTPHLPWVAAETGHLRAIAGPGLLLAAGGPHVSAEPQTAAACGFNLIFLGPGEKTFLCFGQELAAGKTFSREPLILDGRDPVRIDGVRAESTWQSYIPVSKYMKTVPPLEITRGCFWNCRYCQTGGAHPSYRGDESIRSYLAELRERRLERVGFICPSALEFGADKALHLKIDRIAALLDTCRSAGFRFIEYGIFPSEMRPDTVRGIDLSLLRRTVSNRRLTFGAQSAADERLAAIGRGHRVADIVEAVKAANDAGFAANLDFIIALPGETIEDRRGLLELMKMLKKKYRVFFQLHHFFPLAGSPFARRLPSYLNDSERQVFADLKQNGLASDWWQAGERVVRDYCAWLEGRFPAIFGEYH